MRILVTGSSGHLGEALMRVGRDRGLAMRGLDLQPSRLTDHAGSLLDAATLDAACHESDAIIHTATLHKPHVATHDRARFIDTNITGTLNLLEAALRHGIRKFVFTSTTSVFGDALVPPPGAPAAWITEDVQPVPKNIYGVTKAAAEDLCRLFHRNHGLAVIVLRTSRFFPEADDDASARAGFADANLKTNEFLHRRVAIEDAVDAHFLALERASAIGFGRYIISATTPFEPDDMPALRLDAAAVLDRRLPGWRSSYNAWGWRMFKSLDRVYVNACARAELGWSPRCDFSHQLARRRQGQGWQGELALAIGAKGYHDRVFADGPFPVD